MAAGFILMVIILIAVIIYLYQAQNWHGPIVNFIIIVAILLTLTSIFVVYSRNPVDFSSPQGFIEFTKAYFQWWGSLVKNTKGIAGYVINQDWGVNTTSAG